MKKTIASFIMAAAFLAIPIATAQAMPDFGSDSGDYANDGECDDPRFEGEGMTDTPLLEADVRADATDCKKSWNEGKLQLVDVPAQGDKPDFGDDASSFANDGECDDPRFAGSGMTDTLLIASDRMHDATDCETAWDAGTLHLADDTSGQTPDFGDDSSSYSNDDECDDPRFEGEGMTSTTLLESDRKADATDCQAAWDAGKLQWATKGVDDLVDTSGVDFGDDASLFANDGECDDPRFAGDGMTSTTLIDSDRMHDATDCEAAWAVGELHMADEALETTVDISEVDFGDDASMFANDDECDDPRFAGKGMTETTLIESDRMHDATDCRAAYEAGLLRLK